MKLKDLWEDITWPFVAPVVHYLDCRQQNIDGSWDKYHARRNARMQRREERRKRREVK